MITAVYDPCVKYRLIEEGGPDPFTELEDGRLYTTWQYANLEEAILHFLSFGEYVEVVEPAEAREMMKEVLVRLAKKYA